MTSSRAGPAIRPRRLIVRGSPRPEDAGGAEAGERRRHQAGVSADQEWDLGHVDGDRSQYAGPEHAIHATARKAETGDRSAPGRE